LIAWTFASKLKSQRGKTMWCWYL